MVLIPTGPFGMGDHFNEGPVWEQPVHIVTLDQFYMDATEVTVGRFRKFVNQSGYAYPGNWENVVQYSPTDDLCDLVGCDGLCSVGRQAVADGSGIGIRCSWRASRQTLSLGG